MNYRMIGYTCTKDTIKLGFLENYSEDIKYAYKEKLESEYGCRAFWRYRYIEVYMNDKARKELTSYNAERLFREVLNEL